VAGKEIVMVAEEEPKVVDIMTALKASIDAAKKKPMEKAKGAAAKARKEVAKKTTRRKAG
jgi:DNA end-binding protein Ku